MTRSQTNLAWDTLLDLGDAGCDPLHDRLGKALRAAVREGRIPAGAALPPSRTLAADLGCSRWVVTEAYAQLVAEGYLEGRTGSATRVRWSGADEPGPRPAAQPAPAPQRMDLAPGLPDLRAFPRKRWADAVSAAIATAPYTDFGHPQAGGHARLRTVLAEYLQRVRGARARPEDVTVCTGVTEGVARTCRALRDAGVTAVAVEDPGWHRLRDVVVRAGLEAVPVGVDEYGMRVAELARSPGVRAAVVTPAHQFPAGAVLAPERRAALLDWARRVDGVVVEDDYDAEFRYDRRPVGTVQGMDPGRVVLCGSVSKTLSPALGIGWVVTPPRWTGTVRAALPVQGPPVLDQAGLATFVEWGSYDRQLRAVRVRYRERRDALVNALGALLPEGRVAGASAGLHLLLHLGSDADPAAVVAAAAASGLAVVDLAAYRAGGSAGDPGLVLGYGNLADGLVTEAVRTLAAAVRGARVSG